MISFVFDALIETFLADRDDFKSGPEGGFMNENTDAYGGFNYPDIQRHHRDPVSDSLTSPRRVPVPSVRNGFNPPDLSAIVQKERQQQEYADMLKQQMREREDMKAAAKNAKRIEEEAELDLAPHQPVKSFAKQKVSNISTTFKRLHFFVRSSHVSSSISYFDCCRP